MTRFFLVVFFTLSASASDICDNWLVKTKAKPHDKDCKLVCSIADTDMATYMCPVQCEAYCTLKCNLDPFWQKALDAEAKPFKSLAGIERDQVSSA